MNREQPISVHVYTRALSQGILQALIVTLIRQVNEL